MTATHGEGAYGFGVGVTTPTAHKMAQTTEFVKTTTANVIRPGILYNGTASLVSGAANMSYNVAAFSIVTQRSATAGVIKWANDATVNVLTTAAPGSNSRIDTVYAWHREYALDGVDSNPVIGVAQGTAAASPTAPSLAAFPGAIELARIVVPAGVTATNSGTTFTQNCPFTSVDGGTVPFRTTTEMNLWTTALTDQKALDLSSGITYRYSGSAWKGWESDWITYTPTLANVTLGTGGTTTAQYRYAGANVVQVRFKVLLGTGGSVGSGPTITLPVTHATLFINDQNVFGDLGYLDATAGTLFPGKALMSGSSTTVVRLYHTNTGAYTGITATVPFTWAVSDVLQGTLEYLAA